MADALASSVAELSQSTVRQRQGFSSYAKKLSLFAVSYLIAYGYGTLFLQTAPAPLWFPDSVLLCTLLLTPISEWWLYLAIVVPIRFIPAPHPVVPVWFVFATSVNDILKATVAAYLLRRLPNGSKHPSSMPQLATYFGVAVFAVPIFSAVAGAATRYLLGYSFWGSWYRWFLGDALANIVLTPAILYWSSKHSRARRPHAVELAVWVAGFALSLMIALTLAQSDYSPIAVSLPVPFLIWAATRFGLIGASTPLSVIAILATARIAEKSTLFSMGFESKSLLFLQLFLFVVSIPVLCIAAVMEEKNSVEKKLREDEQRLRLAAQAGRMFAYSWDAATDAIARSGESVEILGVKNDQAATGTAISAMVHPDDKKSLEVALAKLTPENPELEITYRIIRPDGWVVWLQRSSRAYFDEHARLERIVGMIADVTERKRAEEALVKVNRTLQAQSALLQSSEELLKIFVKNVPAAVAMLNREMRYVQVSDRWCTEYLSGSEEIVGRSHYELFPDMPERWKEVHRRALAGETLKADEDHWVGQDGSHWARWEVRPWKTPDNSVGGILILAEDITRRKRAEEALAEMTRKLIQAQEQERARIGRELHDDINQRLAVLAIELEELKESPSQVESRVEELRKQITEISTDVQAISHELHSSKLEYLGAVRGMKSWCREFAERQKMEIDCKLDVQNTLPTEIGLCLFRVLQEALHNAAKHSGVKQIEVELREEAGEIHLTIRDLGKGFDIEAAMQGKGLGLTSMQERVRLVNGTIMIESKPMGGTTIHVRVPLELDQGQRAAV